ncbi:Hypothetical protein AA314_07779 [Archangium gephyra]|uniref:Uncharacterized protein n=1 Tax=Archangium gephyra TaxID=48 RepID=A0AAC8QEA7_9BACT|nr:Hypothetical protein AA314_07779 [Archangium gephyra]
MPEKLFGVFISTPHHGCTRRGFEKDIGVAGLRWDAARAGRRGPVQGDERLPREVVEVGAYLHGRVDLLGQRNGQGDVAAHGRGRHARRKSLWPRRYHDLGGGRRGRRLDDRSGRLGGRTAWVVRRRTGASAPGVRQGEGSNGDDDDGTAISSRSVAHICSLYLECGFRQEGASISINIPWNFYAANG